MSPARCRLYLTDDQLAQTSTLRGWTTHHPPSAGSGVTLGTMAEFEYFCTHSAHDPDSLSHHMNRMARDGWDLLTVDFAVRGETGFHTFFWRRPPRNPAQVSQRPASAQE